MQSSSRKNEMSRRTPSTIGLAKRNKQSPPGTLLTQHLQSEDAARSLMTLSMFVEGKFVPEFVAAKKLAGRTYYQAILKHVIPPQEVDRIFKVGARHANAKLALLSDWPYLGSLQLRDVRTTHVQQLISAAANRGYSPKTIKHIRSVVSSIFSFARLERVFTGDNPARLATLPGIVRKDVPLLTILQAKDVLRLMRYPEKEMTLLTLFTNMNVVEICGLQWKHVNLSGGRTNNGAESIPPLSIAVRKKWYRGELNSVNDSRKRNLQIPEMLLPMFLRLKSRVVFTDPEDYVLASRAGSPINAMNITIRRLKSIGEELQIAALSWQTLRAAHVSLIAEFGARFQYNMAMAVDSDLFLDAGLTRSRKRSAEPTFGGAKSVVERAAEETPNSGSLSSTSSVHTRIEC